MNTPISFFLNAKSVSVNRPAHQRLSDCLRNDLAHTGTKIGCEAGDCGACTVLIDGEQACACIVPLGQAAGAHVMTVEGLADDKLGSALQTAFVELGAAQCGICTPGMLMAARDLLGKVEQPSEAQVLDALGGVLCRCTGYRKIIDAVLAVGSLRVEQTGAANSDPCNPFGQSVGQRLARLDAPAKVNGSDCFGADIVPNNTLQLLVVRSPYAHARFTIDNAKLQAFIALNQLVGVVLPQDIFNNAFAIFADLRDQPAIADGIVRYKGEAVLALVGSAKAIAAIDLTSAQSRSLLPILYEALPEQLLMEQSLAPGAFAVQKRYLDNVLCAGRVAKNWHPDTQHHKQGRGNPQPLTASMSTQHVEHAYIEPEAGYATWNGDTLTVFACTQTPYMDRDELAYMFNLAAAKVRIIPSAVGGGFGGKLDLSLQPIIAAAAIKFKQPVRCVYNRPESMISTTKRHPAHMQATLTVDDSGDLLAYEFTGDFNTGPYASWGPTVANRVPIHACGPYRFKHVLASTRAVLTNNSVCGAFRGFGVPQSTLINERLVDEAALRAGRDPLEYRFDNALRAGDSTATGQVLAASVGLRECLSQLRPVWSTLRLGAQVFNDEALQNNNPLRRGVGVACMWYGIGNTVIANPSTMRVGIKPNGRVMLYNGAVDIGQGTYTVMPQICSQALGLPVSAFDQIKADTHLTLDAGKSSASRQTFVSEIGRAHV